jgi:hypothetical protein
MWGPGRCAYCNGIGAVDGSMLQNVAVDEAYLTNSISSAERLRLINRDNRALERANDAKREIEEIVTQIADLHFNEKLTAEEITDYLLAPQLINLHDVRVIRRMKMQTLHYVDTVIAYARSTRSRY